MLFEPKGSNSNTVVSNQAVSKSAAVGMKELESRPSPSGPVHLWWGALWENTGRFCKVNKSFSLTFSVYFASFISWRARVCAFTEVYCEVRGCLGISYPLQACGSLGMNLGHQAGWQSLLSVATMLQDKSSDALVNTLGQVAPGCLCKAAHLSASLSTTVTWGSLALSQCVSCCYNKVPELSNTWATQVDLGSHFQGLEVQDQPPHLMRGAYFSRHGGKAREKEGEEPCSFYTHTLWK